MRMARASILCPPPCWHFNLRTTVPGLLTVGKVQVQVQVVLPAVLAMAKTAMETCVALWGACHGWWCSLLAAAAAATAVASAVVVIIVVIVVIVVVPTTMIRIGVVPDCANVLVFFFV